MNLLAVAALGVALAAPGAAASCKRAGAPEWWGRTPEDADGSVFFTGMATSDVAAEEAVRRAQEDALKRAAMFVETQGNITALQRVTRAGVGIAQEMRSAGRFALAGLRTVETRESCVRTGGGLEYRVWVLVSYPLAEAEAEKRRRRAERGKAAQVFAALCERAAAVGRGGKRFKVLPCEGGGEAGKTPLCKSLESELAACLQSAGGVQGGSRPAEVTVRARHWTIPGGVRVEVEARRAGAPGVLLSTGAFLPASTLTSAWTKSGGTLIEESFEEASEAPLRAAGSLRVESEPAGATIYVDGTDRGRTPAVLLDVTPGGHSVALQLDGFHPVDRKVSVRAGEASRPPVFLLKRKTGVLKVRSEPQAASFTLNGEARGRTPMDLPNLPTGVYAVSLELPDHRSYDGKVEVEYGKTTLLERALEPMPGSLFVLVEPSGAMVRVDGRAVGESTRRGLNLDGVEAGYRTVTAALDGFDEGSWRVEVEPNGRASVTGTLRRERKPERPPREPFRFPRLAWHRPESMVFYSALGGAVTSGGGSLSLLEGRAYLGSYFGFGGALFTMRRPGVATQRLTTTVSGGVARTAVQNFDVSFVNFFPMRVSFAPLTRSYSFGQTRTAAVLEVFGEGCWWSRPMLPDGVLPAQFELPVGSVVDFGLLLHAGLGAGLRAGIVQARMPAFAYANQRFSAVNDARPYIAVQFDLGGYVVR